MLLTPEASAGDGGTWGWLVLTPGAEKDFQAEATRFCGLLSVRETLITEQH